MKNKREEELLVVSAKSEKNEAKNVQDLSEKDLRAVHGGRIRIPRCW